METERGGSSKLSPCATCGKLAKMTCSRCQGRVSYCNRECQRKDWKQHKKICFPPGARCTRCLEMITDENVRSGCRIPHPTHLLNDMGSMMSSSGSKWNFECGACGSYFVKAGPDFNARDTACITEGPKYCYTGPHTIQPISSKDHRRIQKDILVLEAKSNAMQAQIDAIPSSMANVRILTIQSIGCYDDKLKFQLEIPMPQLEVLQLTDVCFTKLTLNEELTPNLRSISMQNMEDDCEISILLPKLKELEMQYYCGEEDRWMHDMLAEARDLESFNSYKLQRVGALNFASDQLHYIRLHRADCLQEVSVYAPRLVELNLQACYDIEEIHILDAHPRFPDNSGGTPTTFRVQTENALLSESARNTLRTHPRVLWDGDNEDGDNAGFMGPFSALRYPMR